MPYVQTAGGSVWELSAYRQPLGLRYIMVNGEPEKPFDKSEGGPFSVSLCGRILSWSPLLS